LHQVGLLDILPTLADGVIVPQAVQQEIEIGLKRGVNLPKLEELDWLEVRLPQTAAAVPLISDLGPGEVQVLMLALELPGAIAVLDDGLARSVAEMLDLPITGTLGLLLDAKRANLVPTVGPVLDQLEALRFRLASDTRATVLKMAGEA
jgi:predicted nucleic acid-binding protein